MSKKNDQYIEPESTDLTGEPAGEKLAAVEEIPLVKEPAYTLPGQTIPNHIGIGKLLNAKGTGVTDILSARVTNHLEFITGKKGFNSKEAKAEEQGGFINTVLGSLELDFDKFVVFTDFLLTQLRANATEINSGKMLRFMGGLSDAYDKDKIKKYTTYISFLIRIALNWNIRYKLNTLIDVNLFAAQFSKQGNQNIVTYFNHLQDV